MYRPPSIRLAVALGAALATLSVADSAQAQVVQPFPKTLVVLGSNTPANNGANLLSAITTPAMPGPNDRWVVILEPGEYDIGSSTLVLRNFVDLAGSGRNSSHIVGSGSVVVSAPTGIDTEIRDLTIIGQSSSSVTGLDVETTELKVTTVNVEVESGGDGTGVRVTAAGRPRFSAVFPKVSASGSAIGFDVSGGEGAIVNELFIFILSTGSTNIGALFRGNTGEAVFEQASGFIAGAQENYGIYVQAAQPRITNNQWTVDGFSSASTSVGLRNEGDTAVKDSQIAAGASSQNLAIEHRQGTLELQSVVAETFSASGPILQAIPVALEVSQGTVEINQCVLESNVAVRTASGSTFLSGASKLSGSRVVGGSSRCAQSYDGSFADIPNGPC